MTLSTWIGWSKHSQPVCFLEHKSHTFISCLTFTVSDKTDRCHDTYNNMQMATVRLQCFSPFWIPGYKGHWDGGQRQAWVFRQDCGRHGMLAVLSCRWPVLTPGRTAVPACCHQIKISSGFTGRTRGISCTLLLTVGEAKVHSVSLSSQHHNCYQTNKHI